MAHQTGKKGGRLLVLYSKIKTHIASHLLLITVATGFIISLSVSDNVIAQDEIMFTIEQVENGEKRYQLHCEMCHGTALNNGQFGAPIRGRLFREKWTGKSLGELASYVYEEMPQGNGESLPISTYTDILAFVLEANNIDISGATELSDDYQALALIPLPW